MTTTTHTKSTSVARTTAKAATTVFPLVDTPSGGRNGAVSFSAPGLAVWSDPVSRQSLLGDPERSLARRALAAKVRTLLQVNDRAAERDEPLGLVADELGKAHRKSVESAWVSVLSQNKGKEEAVRQVQLFFDNLEDAAPLLRGRVTFADMTAEELASKAGRDALDRLLENYAQRPDNRQSRAFVVSPGFVGSAAALNKLARVVSRYRGVFFTDAPRFESMKDLEAAAMPGGVLDTLPSDESHYRFAAMIGNRGRARHAFVGKDVAEEEDLFIGLSLPWTGMYLRNIVLGEPWKVTVGHQNRLAGIDGVELDLVIGQNGHHHFSNHRIIPALRLSANSNQVVMWGADSMCKAGGGVQVGVGVVTMHIVRYTDRVLKEYGLFNDLEKSEEEVGKILSVYLRENSGHGRMFRSGSKVSVVGDEKKKTLNVCFDLRFREVVESATIEIVRKDEDTNPADYKVS